MPLFSEQAIVKNLDKTVLMSITFVTKCLIKVYRFYANFQCVYKIKIYSQ